MSLLDLFRKHCLNLSNSSLGHEINESNVWLTSLESLYPSSVLLELFLAYLSTSSSFASPHQQSSGTIGLWTATSVGAAGLVNGDLFICCTLLHSAIQRQGSHWNLCDKYKKLEIVQFLITLPKTWSSCGLMHGPGPLLHQLSKILSAVLCAEIMSPTCFNIAQDMIMEICGMYSSVEDNSARLLTFQILEQLPQELRQYVDVNGLSGETVSSPSHVFLSSLGSFLLSAFQYCAAPLAATLNQCDNDASISMIENDFHNLRAIAGCLRAWSVTPFGLRGDSFGSDYELLNQQKWLVAGEQDTSEQFSLLKLVFQTQNLIVRHLYSDCSYSAITTTYCDILSDLFEIQNHWINSTSIPAELLNGSNVETQPNYDVYIGRGIIVQLVFWGLQGCWELTCQQPVADWFFEASSTVSPKTLTSGRQNIQERMGLLQSRAMSLSKDPSKSQASLFQMCELTCALCEKHANLLLTVSGHFVSAINCICFPGNDSAALEARQRQVLATIVSLLACQLCLRPLHVSALAFDVLAYLPKIITPSGSPSILTVDNFEFVEKLFQSTAVTLQDIISIQSQYAINISIEDILASECRQVFNCGGNRIEIDDEVEESLLTIQRYRIDAGQLHQSLFTNWQCEGCIIMRRAQIILESLHTLLDELGGRDTRRFVCIVREIDCGLLLLFNVMDIAEDISFPSAEASSLPRSSAFASAKDQTSKCADVWLPILVSITLKIKEVTLRHHQSPLEATCLLLLMKRQLELWSRAADLFTLPSSGAIFLDQAGGILILPLVIQLIYPAIQLPSLIHAGTNTLWAILRAYLNKFVELSVFVCQNIIPVIMNDSVVLGILQRDTTLTEKLYQCIGMLISTIPPCNVSRQMISDAVLPTITAQLQMSLQCLEQCSSAASNERTISNSRDLMDRRRTMKICSYYLSCMKGLIQGANFSKQVMEEDSSGTSDGESYDSDEEDARLNGISGVADIFSNYVDSLMSGLLAMVEIIYIRNTTAASRLSRDEIESTCQFIDRIFSVLTKLLDLRDASLVLSDELVNRILLIAIDSSLPVTELPNLLTILIRQTALAGNTSNVGDPDSETPTPLPEIQYTYLTAALLLQCDTFMHLIKSKEPLLENSFTVQQCLLYFSNCLKLIRQWSISQPELIICDIASLVNKLGALSHSNPRFQTLGRCITAATAGLNENHLMRISLLDIYLNTISHLIELSSWIVVDANILRFMSSSLTTLDGCHSTFPVALKLQFATIVAQRSQAIINAALYQLILQVDPRCNRMLSLVLDGMISILYNSHNSLTYPQIRQRLFELAAQTTAALHSLVMRLGTAFAENQQRGVGDIVATSFNEVHTMVVQAFNSPSVDPLQRIKPTSKWIILAKSNSVKQIVAIMKEHNQC